MEKQKLENYLARLEYCLGGTSVADKAEIITEIKSHVLDKQENHPDQTLDEILRSLGSPDEVAHRYLSERGIKYQAPNQSKISTVKWLVIGFLGTIGMGLMAVFILIWKFSPLVDVDETNKRVKVLGGLIDVKKKNGTITVDGDIDINIEEVEIDEVVELKEMTKDQVIDLRFSNVKLDVKRSKNSQMRYECEGLGEYTKPQSGELLFDFSSMTAIDCTFKVPADKNLNINVLNGKVTFSQLQNNVNFKGTNVKLDIAPEKEYLYNLKVLNGSVDQFTSVNDSRYEMSAQITNGFIQKI